jgi:hypothetical protein
MLFFCTFHKHTHIGHTILIADLLSVHPLSGFIVQQLKLRRKFSIAEISHRIVDIDVRALRVQDQLHSSVHDVRQQ